MNATRLRYCLRSINATVPQQGVLLLEAGRGLRVQPVVAQSRLQPLPHPVRRRVEEGLVAQDHQSSEGATPPIG